jgi:5-methylcytosine-specific restriction endonuclease McrA
MAANPGFCASCGTTGGIEEHHLVPRVLGGHARPTVYLCSMCHGLAHSCVRPRDLARFETSWHG